MTLFWALFGLGQPDDMVLETFNNPLTENIGRVLYMVYHFICIIILLNMLVASMTQSYEKILVSFYF